MIERPTNSRQRAVIPPGSCHEPAKIRRLRDQLDSAKSVIINCVINFALLETCWYVVRRILGPLPLIITAQAMNVNVLRSTAVMSGNPREDLPWTFVQRSPFIDYSMKWMRTMVLCHPSKHVAAVHVDNE